MPDGQVKNATTANDGSAAKESAVLPAPAAALERLTEAGVRATKSVRSGPALEHILLFADDQDADLIVIGSGSRRGLSARLLGSVPLWLVQRSPRPVLVVTDAGEGR